MLTTRVLTSSAIESEKWADRILALDRENMTQILRGAGLPFPEDKRRRGLRDPSTVLIALLDDGALAGYVQLCKDWNCDKDIYLGSIQVRKRYRRGRAFAILVVECARQLKSRSFNLVRTHVQANNHVVIELCRKLGFRVSKVPEVGPSLELAGSRALLESEALCRLEKAVASVMSQ